MEEQACDEQRRAEPAATPADKIKAIRMDGFYFGTRRTIVEEPLSWAIEHPIEWREPRFDLAELAKLRWIKKWRRKDLAKRFGRTECAIQNHFRKLKQLDFAVPGLSESDRRRIKAMAR